MSRGYLESLRLAELEIVLGVISKTRREKDRRDLVILEIGAGAGWQANKLNEAGYTVEAIDVEDSNYSAKRVWFVKNYDGMHIPFSDNYFDIIFSSNVLEHIPHVKAFQREMQRVLKPDGTAIHIVPSCSWRFWTNMTHYPFIIKTSVKILCSKIIRVPKDNNCSTIENHPALCAAGNLSKRELARKAIFPTRHGAAGNAFSEMYRFSRSRWSALFEQSDWKIIGIIPNKLFYTGFMILGFRASVQIRKYISYVLGSSCHIFVLTKKSVEQT